MRNKLVLLLLVGFIVAGCSTTNESKPLNGRKISVLDNNVVKSVICRDRYGDVIPKERGFVINGKQVCFDGSKLDIYVGDNLVDPMDSEEYSYPKTFTDLIKKIFIPESVQILDFQDIGRH